jgi:hypothetical protein
MKIDFPSASVGSSQAPTAAVEKSQSASHTSILTPFRPPALASKGSVPGSGPKVEGGNIGEWRALRLPGATWSASQIYFAAPPVGRYYFGGDIDALIPNLDAVFFG